MTAQFKTIDGEHTVDATQITYETFDSSQSHLIGVAYDPLHHLAMVPTQQGETIAKIGDWIIQAACELAVLPAREFAEKYELLSCDRCEGARWLCEQHRKLAWPHGECAGPGEPCPDCNLLAGTGAELAD